MNGLQGVAHGLAELGDLEAGVGGVPAAVVEEIADIVGLEDLDQALVFGPVVLQAFQLVTAGAKGARGGGQQAANSRLALLAGVYQVLAQRADNAVAAGVYLADAIPVLPGGLDHATGGGIDYGGDSTGLGVKSVLLRHGRRPLVCGQIHGARVCGRAT